MSGARRLPASSAPPEVIYRGVRWRRSASSERISWFNEGLGRWVVWVPKSDAPPLPPEYAAPITSGAGGPAGAAGPVAAGAGNRGTPIDAMSARKPMTSPYRLVPVIIAVLVVVLALWQATRPPARATQADISAAQALRGQCLQRHGGTTFAPIYAPAAVSCQSARASVKVVAVLVPGKPGSCPPGSAVIQVLQAGVTGEPSECILPLKVK
jgi:hypothetical protein